MPFTLAAGLGEAGAAVLLALLCMAAIYLIRAIAAALPRINLHVVVLDFPRWFSAIADPVVSWLVGATNLLWADAGWWMHGIAYIATGLFDDVKNALVTDAGFIAHLYTAVIPQAISHAGSAAASFVNSEIATLHRDISTVTGQIERVATADAARALAKAEGFTRTISGDLTRIVAHDLTHAEHYADAELAKLRTWTGDAIGAIHVPTLESIGAASAGALAAIAARVVAVERVATEFESCGVTSCAGPNNLQNLLNGVLGLAGLAEFAAFLAEVINDPAGAEQKYAAVFQGLIGAGTAAFDELLAL